MKYINFLIAAIFLLGFFFFSNNKIYAQRTSDRCLGYSVVFSYAENWDRNNTITVSCRQSPNGIPCGGGVNSRTIGLGGIASLDRCDCFEQDCIDVQVPPGCTKTSGKICGTNDNYEQTGSISVRCPAPTPTPCTDIRQRPYDQCGGNCNGTNYGPNEAENITETNTCGTLTYACNNHQTCTYGCTNGKCNPPPSSGPKPSSPLPPTVPPGGPTSPPNCVKNTCEPINPSCRRCDVNGNWQKDFTCDNFNACCTVFPGTPGCPTPPPGSSPTPPGGGSPTPKPPTPTPTPDFNEAMCECDSIESTPIISGQKVTFTTFGKVIGTNTSKAKIESMEYFLGEETDPTRPNNAHIIDRSGAIPAQVVASSPSLARYKTIWSKTMMSNPSSNNFRLWTNIKCVKKTTAMINNRQSSVLAAATSPFSSLWNSITGSFSSLFGGSTPTSRKNLQLETFYPAKTIQKTCQMIRFKF